MIPYREMTKKNNTIHDFGGLALKESYSLKFRLKEFEVVHADGSSHKRGPCLSMQLFSPKGRFIQGRVISIDIGDLERFMKKLSEIAKFLDEWKAIRSWENEPPLYPF